MNCPRGLNRLFQLFEQWKISIKKSTRRRSRICSCSRIGLPGFLAQNRQMIITPTTYHLLLTTYHLPLTTYHLLHFNNCSLPSYQTPRIILEQPNMCKAPRHRFAGIRLLSLWFNYFSSHNNCNIIIECNFLDGPFK